jgi:coenzyme PQQ synthesis protein D (PqqD)
MDSNGLTLDNAVKIDDEVVFRVLDGEAVILNLKKGIYFGLNEVGTRVWQLIQEEKPLREIFETLKGEYEVAPEQLECDLLGIVGRLAAKGLVRVL